jgi:hypothetical protein
VEQAANVAKLWKFNPATEKFACIFPGCGYDHHDPGGVNLHYYKKHGPNPGRTTSPASASRKTAEAAKVKPMQKRVQQPSALGHDWRLLNPRDPMERAALAKGASEICDDCQEVR